jgi:hypothetical protein
VRESKPGADPGKRAWPNRHRDKIDASLGVCSGGAGLLQHIPRHDGQGGLMPLRSHLRPGGYDGVVQDHRRATAGERRIQDEDAHPLGNRASGENARLIELESGRTVEHAIPVAIADVAQEVRSPAVLGEECPVDDIVIEP